MVKQVTQEAATLPGVVGAVDPYQVKALSPDGRYALIQVQFAGRADDVTDAQRAAYEKVGAQAEAQGWQIAPGGEVLNGEPEVGSTEALGVLVAAIVLVITFGSLVAAGMTMLNALIGVGVGMAGLFALSGAIELTSTAPILALMLGLAVGIDYSLFITSRHRQNLLDGLSPEEAVGRAVGTAGSAVVFAGATVVIALAGLAVVDIPFLTVMGLAAAGTVTVAVLVAITLAPGPARLRRHAGCSPASCADRVAAGDRPPAEDRSGFGFRWAHWSPSCAIPVILVGLLGLGPARAARPGHAAGAAGRQHRAGGHPGPGQQRTDPGGLRPGLHRPARGGRHRRLAAGHPGRRTAGDRADPEDRRGARGGPAAARPDRPDRAARGDPEDRPDRRGHRDAGARHPPRRSPASTNADVLLTGVTAIGIDVSEKLSDALPVYLLLVVGLSILLLMLVFRSILVPVKAALGFLLTVAATFGITVAIFQQGHLADLVGLDTPGPLVSFLPILLIGILFGLAMDYEVFLVSRMREDFVHGDTARQATINGMGHGARVVTAAALIMISVFGGFVFLDDPIIKSMGFALAIGVAIDAFVVRMTIVPAVMSLLGQRAPGGSPAGSTGSCPTWTSRARACAPTSPTSPATPEVRLGPRTPVGPAGPCPAGQTPAG